MTDFAIATQILVDGPRNTVAKTTGNFPTATPPGTTTILDPSLLSDMNPGMSGAKLATLLRVDHIDYAITDGVLVQLLWDATTPVPIVELYGRGKLEAKMWGGYQNNAGAGVTGKILMSVLSTSASFPTETSLLLVMACVKYRPISAGGV